jgi:CopG family transcriptional regulator, nickel-responsive regulator
MANNNYQNRSEAVRDLVRLGLKRVRLDSSVSGECVTTLSYVFNYSVGETRPPGW